MLELKPYTGWRPNHMRRRGVVLGGAGAGAFSRSNKRGRLSKNPADRALYKSAKGYKTARYAALCKIADHLNGIRR